MVPLFHNVYLVNSCGQFSSACCLEIMPFIPFQYFLDIESYIKQTVDIGLEIEEVKVETKKELHNKRIEDLRSLLTEIAKDNWKYQSVPNILGIPEE